eukprot:4784482-Amphidinium_carterae.1
MQPCIWRDGVLWLSLPCKDRSSKEQAMSERPPSLNQEGRTTCGSGAPQPGKQTTTPVSVSYTHLRAHETEADL